MENQEMYQKAKKRAKAKMGFYIHLSVFIAVNILLLMVNLNSNPEFFWVKYPFMGWGIGLLFHALTVFLFTGKPKLLDRMIDKELKKDN